MDVDKTKLLSGRLTARFYTSLVNDFRRTQRSKRSGGLSVLVEMGDF